MSRKLATLMLSLMLALPALAAGKRFEGIVEMRSREHTKMPFAGEQTRETTEITYYRPGMVKIVRQPDSRVTIIRADKEIIWDIDLKNKTYTEMTFQDVARLYAKMRARAREMQAELAAQLQSLPPEQRKMAEQMAQSGSGRALEEAMQGNVRLVWKDTGEEAQVLGYTCRKYLGLLNEQPIIETWVTDAYDVGEELVATLKAYGLLGGDGKSEIQILHGLPLKTVTTVELGAGSVHRVSEATKVQEAKVAPSEFDLPAGLKKEKSPLEMMEE
ncbi:MAG: DUF4412 domain-containing protein [candidate division KSB1 bacterium]|nr:DUF4412 domain-containing protein [candidate division KSB1 bacterium]